jgi:hemerythrin superfamily protein
LIKFVFEEVKFLEEIKSALGMHTEDKDSFFNILKQEHAQIKQNLKRILDANNPMTDLFSQTVNALNAHMKGEEEYLYPRLEDNASTRQMAFVSYEEHNISKQLLNNMELATDNDRWMAKVRVLYTVLKHHIDVEESEVFPRAKDVLFEQTEREIRKQYITQKTIPTAPTTPQ